MSKLGTLMEFTARVIEVQIHPDRSATLFLYNTGPGPNQFRVDAPTPPGFDAIRDCTLHGRDEKVYCQDGHGGDHLLAIRIAQYRIRLMAPQRKAAT
jgi:hypothetical protein